MGQVDEMFCFVGCRENNNWTEDPERGRQSIFLGVDADSKFIINWMIGKRTSCTIEKYMQDLRLRVAAPFQLSTDGYDPLHLPCQEALGVTLPQIWSHRFCEMRSSRRPIENIHKPTVGQTRI
jgi:hypothetical protein